MRAVPYISSLSSSLREVADLLSESSVRRLAPCSRYHAGGVIHHPNLGNDFADQLTMTEKPHHRTLRDDNSHGFSNCAQVRGGNVTATESQRHVHLCSHGIEIAARGKENSLATYHEPAVQLRQFLDSSAQI